MATLSVNIIYLIWLTNLKINILHKIDVIFKVKLIKIDAA